MAIAKKLDLFTSDRQRFIKLLTKVFVELFEIIMIEEFFILLKWKLTCFYVFCQERNTLQRLCLFVHPHISFSKSLASVQSRMSA